MRTQVLSVKLPLHEAALVRRQAAEAGLTKSAHGANLILRALDLEAAERIPTVFDNLQALIDRLEPLVETLQIAETSHGAHTNNAELRAFMIEVLTLLRYLFKDDLKIKGDVGRRLQKAVGEVRVEGV